LWISKGLWPLPESTTGVNPTVKTTSSTPNINPQNTAPKGVCEDRIINTHGSTPSVVGISSKLHPSYKVVNSGPKVTTSVKIPANLQEMGLKKARRYFYDETRGNMSGLIEMLLEEFINAP
jgi:hypothetical protein